MRATVCAVLLVAAGAAGAHPARTPADPPTRAAILAADPARGAEAFQRICAACHTIERGARRRVGPNLFGIAGAPSAQRAGYPYSDALRQAAIVWDDETLAEFLADPGGVVPGTKMDWSVKETAQIADIVAFLKLQR